MQYARAKLNDFPAQGSVTEIHIFLRFVQFRALKKPSRPIHLKKWYRQSAPGASIAPRHTMHTPIIYSQDSNPHLPPHTTSLRILRSQSRAMTCGLADHTIKIKLKQNSNKPFYFSRNKTLKRFSCLSQSQSVSAVYGLARRQRTQTVIG